MAPVFICAGLCEKIFQTAIDIAKIPVLLSSDNVMRQPM